MRLTSSIPFAVLVGLLSTAGIAGQDTKRSEPFDPSGNYHPVRPPEGSPDKSIQFNLRVRRSKGKLSAAGEVRGVQPWHRFSTVSVDQRRLRFSTVVVRGVRYEVDGKFLEGGTFARHWIGTGLIVLKGKMRKYLRGKQVWEIGTDFVYYPPH